MKERVYISHETAFRLLRSNRSPRMSFAVESKSAYLPVLPKSDDRCRLAQYLSSLGARPPYDIAVAKASDRWTSDPLFSYHVVGPPAGNAPFHRVVEPGAQSLPFELYIASPELSFVQMACRFSLIQSIGYGYELCGSYTPEESGKDEPERLTVLSSPRKLAAFCSRAAGMHGSRRASRASRFVLAGSRSIKETELSMMFSLPRRLDGLNVVPHKLNYPIEVGDRRETFVSQDRFEVDLCWPEYHVGIEVQSSRHHSGEMKLVKDARRKNSLQYYGYTIIEATKGDLSTALGVTGLAKQAYAAMGIRPKKGQFDIDLGRLALYDEVFSLSDYP